MNRPEESIGRLFLEGLLDGINETALPGAIGFALFLFCAMFVYAFLGEPRAAMVCFHWMLISVAAALVLWPLHRYLWNRRIRMIKESWRWHME